MKILVTGADGQLGSDVIRELASRKTLYVGADLKDFDIAKNDQARNFILGQRPDAVIHCAAYTAVDKAEDEKELCFAINESGTRNIASICNEIGAKMLYLSTDYIFSGEGREPHEIEDATGPLSVYGESKLMGEIAVKNTLDNYFIVRISWAFGACGNNFVKTMLRLGKEKGKVDVVCDQIGSPTYTKDLAILLCDIINTDKYGTYHATNEGFCSFADFAEKIFEISGTDAKINRILSSEYTAKAKRPLNSRLSKKSLDSAKFNRLPDWSNALCRFINGLQ